MIRVITDGTILINQERKELEDSAERLFAYILSRYGSGENGSISRQFRCSGRVVRVYASFEQSAIVVLQVYHYLLVDEIPD